MKRLIGVFLFSLLLLGNVFAQEAKILYVKGKVSIKKDASAPWEKAKISTMLGKQAEVKTGAKSECTLSFDETMKNILTLKENSWVKLEDIKPANISLPQGRVFALIDDIKKVEKFEIRTPTAVAGVRGTGESVEFNGGMSIFKCFADAVYVQGLGAQGQSLNEQSLLEGFGINVDNAGAFGQAFSLSEGDLQEWRRFEASAEHIQRDAERTGRDNRAGSASLDELKQDTRQDYGDTILERERRDEESRERCRTVGNETVCD
ncbi:MAG: FecR family protein [Candidatus Omnitrophica bacterium]|nr:FecR family protein [Candidatus Omnitrophota bacterium]